VRSVSRVLATENEHSAWQWVDRGEENPCWSWPTAEPPHSDFYAHGIHLRTIKDEAHMRLPCNFHTQVSGWYAPIWIVRCVFLIESSMWLRNLETERRRTAKWGHAAASRVRNLRPENSSRS